MITNERLNVHFTFKHVGITEIARTMINAVKKFKVLQGGQIEVIEEAFAGFEVG